MLAHEQFSKEHGGGAILTVPLESGGQAVGALFLERQSSSPLTRRRWICADQWVACRTLLDVQRREDRWLGVKAWESLTRFVRNLLGLAMWQ